MVEDNNNKQFLGFKCSPTRVIQYIFIHLFLISYFLWVYLDILQLIMAALTLNYYMIEQILNAEIFWSKLGSRTFFCLLETLEMQTKIQFNLYYQNL